MNPAERAYESLRGGVRSPVARVEFGHGCVAGQQRAVDAVGTADVQDARYRDPPGLPVCLDEPLEVRLGQLRNAVLELAEGTEVRAWIGLRVNVVECYLSGGMETHRQQPP
jgi:hypothetical protein